MLEPVPMLVALHSVFLAVKNPRMLGAGEAQEEVLVVNLMSLTN
jgi:hypothetical protein